MSLSNFSFVAGNLIAAVGSYVSMQRIPSDLGVFLATDPVKTMVRGIIFSISPIRNGIQGTFRRNVVISPVDTGSQLTAVPV